MPQSGEITRLLQRAEEGDSAAAGELFVLVEEDLRRIARKRKRDAALGAAVDASTTGLVDEAFIRLVGQNMTTWEPGDRRKFFAFVSNKIHDFLIDELRKQQAQKRGGDRQQVELDTVVPNLTPEPLGHLDLLIDFKTALLRLEEFGPGSNQAVFG
jgi:RNA polymerase sigma factor (TIGR02999 family)